MPAVGSLPITYSWAWNGNTLPGATASSVSASNAGTYIVTAVNNFGSATGTNFVNINTVALAPTNLVVLQIGDGVESLSTTTGNTVYLHQLQTNGSYLSTIMVPDGSTNSPAGQRADYGRRESRWDGGRCVDRICQSTLLGISLGSM